MKSHSLLIQNEYVLVLFPLSHAGQHLKQTERTPNDKILLDNYIKQEYCF